MRNYVYVQAHMVEICGGPEPLEGLSFRHTIVQADSEDAAYAAGHKWADTQELLPRLQNDYVIAI